MLSVTGICEVVIETTDLEGLERFYTRLGLTTLKRDSDRVWLAAGESSRLGIWSPGEKEHRDRGGKHVHFAFAAPRGKLTELADTLRGTGVELKGPVEHEGGDTSIYFFDPEGNRVEVWDYFHDGDGATAGVAGLQGDEPGGA